MSTTAFYGDAEPEREEYCTECGCDSPSVYVGNDILCAKCAESEQFSQEAIEARRIAASRAAYDDAGRMLRNPKFVANLNKALAK